MNMCFWCVSQISDLSGLHVSLINIASHLKPSSSHTISSILSLECIDLTFFCNMKVMSLLFVFPISWFFFSVVLPHKSLLPLFILLVLLFFTLFEMRLPLTILSSLFFLLLLLLSLFSSSKLRKHSGTSPYTPQCLSVPPPFPFRSSFLLVLFFMVVVFLASCMLESLRQLVWAFACRLLHLCRCRFLLVVFPSSLRLCPVSRLLTVVAMSFLIAIFPFDFRPPIQCLGTWYTW